MAINPECAGIAKVGARRLARIAVEKGDTGKRGPICGNASAAAKRYALYTRASVRARIPVRIYWTFFVELGSPALSEKLSKTSAIRS
jgi:hypothetical protein